MQLALCADCAHLCIGRSARGTAFMAVPPLATAGKLRGRTVSVTADARALLRENDIAWVLMWPAIVAGVALQSATALAGVDSPVSVWPSQATSHKYTMSIGRLRQSMCCPRWLFSCGISDQACALWRVRCLETLDPQIWRLMYLIFHSGVFCSSARLRRSVDDRQVTQQWMYSEAWRFKSDMSRT